MLRNNGRHNFRSPYFPQPSLVLDFAGTGTLDPRVTFTRSTTAPYYDGKTSVLAEQNLLTYSQDFTQSSWTQSGLTSVTASATTAPDGTNTGQLITPNGNSGNHGLIQVSSASTVGKTVSVYAKAGTNNYIQILFGGNANPWANFDLTNGAGAVGSTGTTTTASIVTLANGWFRCILTTSSTTATDFRIFIVTSSTAIRAEANTLTTTVYLWGAQLEQRSSVTAYNATTTSAITNYIPQLLTAPINSPRFDFNPVTGESLGLLIEQSSTNLLTYSQDFSNAAWTKTRASVTTSADIAPDGTQTAQVLYEDTSNNSHLIYEAYTITAGNPYTFSMYAKAWTRTQLGITFDNTSWSFDLSAGTILTGTNGTITPVGNGWYRITCYRASITTASSFVFIIINNAGASSYTGNGYSGIYIWGAQLEALAFPTSYIPTTSAQVTRASDNASMTGTNFSSWYNQGQGTLFVDCANISPRTDLAIYATIVDDAGSIYIRQTNPTTTSAAVDGTFFGTSTISGTAYKAVLAYRVGYVAFSYNGATPITATVASISPNTTGLTLGGGGSGFQKINTSIRKFAYYPQALTSTQL